MTKINKALDFNKLLQSQAQGKLLKKHLSYPFIGSIKYDGNYIVAIEPRNAEPTFHTSGGLTYTHLDISIFDDPHIPKDMVYIAERCADELNPGKLGARNRCNLKGPKTAQTSKGHTYRVIDCLSISDYEQGYTTIPYEDRLGLVVQIFPYHHISHQWIHNREELEAYLKIIVKLGYEGIMGANPTYLWSHSKTRRTVHLFKYKKRPTVDLYCEGVKDGTGQYEGQIGSLELIDSMGRRCHTGSGMSNADRLRDPSYFIGKVVEVFYEQIVDTYIQPTFGDEYEGVLVRDEYEGVLVRDDKTIEDID